MPSPDPATQAACQGSSANFHPYDETAKGYGEALELCRRCPVPEWCLSRALKLGVTSGVWSGIEFEGSREHLDAFRATGDPGHLAKARRATWAARGDASSVPWSSLTPGPRGYMVCTRCGAPVPPPRRGSLPVDRNGPDAKCGKVSTYNRGCRCDPCQAAKQQALARSKG